MCSSDIFLGLLALLFPPLPVWVKCGICSADSIINILLCVLGYVPGLLHAWYIIAKFPDPNHHDYEPVADSERGSGSGNGRITYLVIQDDGQQRRVQGQAGRGPARAPAPAQKQKQANMTYGTSGTSNAASSASSQPQQHEQQQQPHAESSAGPSDGAPPPSYAQVVAGDHKVQDHS